MPTSCPASDMLRLLLAAGVDATPAPGLARHLDACACCRERLQGLAGDAPCDAACAALAATTPTPRQVRCLLETLKRPHAVQGELDALLATMPVVGARRRFGSYEVVAVAGVGGMGIVLQARDPDLDRLVAIKVLRPMLAVIPAARSLFLAEARAMAAVVHEHVVTIHAVGKQDGHPYLVMQWVAGCSLRERIAAVGRLSPPQVLRLGSQAARGLAAVHAQGLVHRDVTPANILLEDGSDRVKLTDFGLAGVESIRRKGWQGDQAGTPRFTAPEVLRQQAVDHRADLFGLGATLYAAYVGQPAPAATGADLRAISPTAGVSGLQTTAVVHEPLSALILELVADDPDRRPARAEAVAERCEALLLRLTPAGRTCDQPERGSRSPRRAR